MTKLSKIQENKRLYILNNIPCKSASYNRDNEQAINPAYEDISNTPTQLAIGEMRIFALRSDFILATGIKNAYQEEYNYYGMQEAFSSSLYQYINWLDRYGHTSLTLSENICLGAYYAGYLCLDENKINVFLASGRYHRDDLTLHSTNILESYIATELQQAYGNKKVTFYHGIKPYNTYPNEQEYYKHLGLFFNPCNALKKEPQRHYPMNSTYIISQRL